MKIKTLKDVNRYCAL